MKLLAYSDPDLLRNLAIDEAILDAVDDGELQEDVLRLWTMPSDVVVLGRASRRAEEANLVACLEDQIPVLRRASGGTAVVVGPGCLLYSVILNTRDRPELAGIDRAHHFVMGRMLEALRQFYPEAQLQGTCDLTLGNRKVSGNSLRCKKEALLYHGTFLLDYPLGNVSRWLGTPPRQPDYRDQRSHGEFVTNLGIKEDALRAAIAAAWSVESAMEILPHHRIEQLLESKYRSPAWHEQR